MYLTTTKLGCSPYVILKLLEGIFLHVKQLIRSCKLVFIDPRFLKIVLNTVKLVLGANK